MKIAKDCVLFACSVILMAGSFVSAQNAGSASGHGSQLVTDPDGNTRRRQFSFSVKANADGTAKGNAILHNPAFTGTENDRRYYLQLKITCVRFFGNIAIVAGTTKRTNDPVFEEIGVFAVEDKGEPGRNLDEITGVGFPTLPPSDDPAFPCNALTPNSFVPGSFQVIDSGNISVRP